MPEIEHRGNSRVTDLQLPDDAISLSDEELGVLLLQLVVLAEAEERGISIDEMPDEFGVWVVEQISKLEAKSAKLAPLPPTKSRSVAESNFFR